MEQARADITSIAAALESEYPDYKRGVGSDGPPLKEVFLGSTAPQLLIFLASVGLVLLIACANLANMTLARAMVRAGSSPSGRRWEPAGESGPSAPGRKRPAGGGRGGIGGDPCLLRTRGIQERLADPSPRMQEIGMNATVLLFSLGLSLVAGVLFGLFPPIAWPGQTWPVP